MMCSLADVLPVFTPSSAIAISFGGQGPDEGPGTMLDEELTLESVVDATEHRIAEARREIEVEAAAALDAALAQQGVELAAQHAAALSEARRRWAEEQGAVLSAQLRVALDGLETSLAESLVHVLEPFFEAATRVRAAGELRQAVADLLANGEGARVRVRGPQDLLGPLEAAFAGRASLDFEVAADSEITVISDHTTIRSQLGAWIATLHAYLAEAR